MPQLADYTCAWCAAVFQATQPALYCSGVCQMRVWRQRNPRPRPRKCDWCSEQFDARERPFLRYCSEEHTRLAALEAGRQRRLRKNPYWTVNCLHCGAAFETNTRKKKFCTERCCQQHNYLRGAGARRQRVEKWIKGNPTEAKLARAEWAQRQRARRAGSKDSVAIDPRDWYRLVNRYGGCCAYCGEKAPVIRDHVVPIARGGRHSIGNVLPCCARCNADKKAKFLMVWKVQQRKAARLQAAGTQLPLFPDGVAA